MEILFIISVPLRGWAVKKLTMISPKKINEQLTAHRKCSVKEELEQVAYRCQQIKNKMNPTNCYKIEKHTRNV